MPISENEGTALLILPLRKKILRKRVLLSLSPLDQLLVLDLETTHFKVFPLFLNLDGVSFHNEKKAGL